MLAAASACRGRACQRRCFERGGSPPSAEGATIASLRSAAWIENAAALTLDGTPLSGALPIVPGLVLRAPCGRDARAGRGRRPPSRREPVGGRGSRRSAQPCWTHSAARSPLLTTASSASLSRRESTEREETERVYTLLGRVVDPRGEARRRSRRGSCRGSVPCGGDAARNRSGRAARGPPDASIAARCGRSLARRGSGSAKWGSRTGGGGTTSAGWSVYPDGERPVALVWRRGRYERSIPSKARVHGSTPATAGKLARPPTCCTRVSGVSRPAAASWCASGSCLRGRTSPAPGLLDRPRAAVPGDADRGPGDLHAAVPEGNRGQVLGLSLVLAGSRPGHGDGVPRAGLLADARRGARVDGKPGGRVRPGSICLPRSSAGSRPVSSEPGRCRSRRSARA